MLRSLQKYYHYRFAWMPDVLKKALQRIQYFIFFNVYRALHILSDSIGTSFLNITMI